MIFLWRKILDARATYLIVFAPILECAMNICFINGSSVPRDKINTLRPEQNGRHFGHFEYTFEYHIRSLFLFDGSRSGSGPNKWKVITLANGEPVRLALATLLMRYQASPKHYIILCKIISYLRLAFNTHLRSYTLLLLWQPNSETETSPCGSRKIYISVQLYWSYDSN